MKSQVAPYESTYMAAAVALAKRSLPSPNPRVGALLVKDNIVVGRGYHEKPGSPHAEIMAIRDAGESARGADLYVTLEPCVHVGRTGPCVKAVEQAGIKRVFIGIADPDERVNGKGIAYLRDVGIEVETGVDAFHCRQLLESYITHRTKGRPHITLKAAITLDGCIATTTHDSQWISSGESRKVAHQLRADADAVLVGINTVLHDNPSLTVRDAEGQSPLRVVLDSSLRIADSSNLIRTADENEVLLICTETAPRERLNQLSKFSGIGFVECRTDHNGNVNLHDMAQKLGKRGILSLLVEGGSRVHSSFLEAKLADQLILFISPKIVGKGIPWTVFPGAELISGSLTVSPVETRRIADDILYRATLNYPD